MAAARAAKNRAGDLPGGISGGANPPRRVSRTFAHDQRGKLPSTPAGKSARQARRRCKKTAAEPAGFLKEHEHLNSRKVGK